MPITVNVLEITGIYFYESFYDPESSWSKIYYTPAHFTEHPITAQGKFFNAWEGYGIEVRTTDGIFDGFQAMELGLSLTSSDPSVVWSHGRFIGYNMYALKNGTATLTATAPDGTFGAIDVTVAIPQDADQFISVSLPPTVSNNAPGPIYFTAVANTDLTMAGRGTEEPGVMNFSTNFLDVTPVLSNGNQTMSIAFNFTHPPADIGTGVYSVSIAPPTGPSSLVALPLTTVNDPIFSGMRFNVIVVHPEIYHSEMFDIEFYAPNDLSTPLFTRQIDAMHSISGVPIDVGAIPPGTYAIRFIPFLPAQPQWWPGTVDPNAAVPLTFTAGTDVENIFFFADKTLPGDVNCDTRIDMADAILALQVFSGMNPANVFNNGDIDYDWKIGMLELLYVLQHNASLR